MKPHNFLREVRECISHGKDKCTIGFLYKTHVSVRDIFKHAVDSVKFILPEGGRILDGDLSGLPTELILPYDSVVIEYTTIPGSVSLAEKVMGKENTSVCPKRIIIAKQTKDKKTIKVNLIYWSDDSNEWFVSPFTSEIIKTDLEGLNMFEELTDVVKPINIGYKVTYSILPGFESTLPLDWMKMAAVDLNDEINAVLQLIQSLACVNVLVSPLTKTKASTVKERKSTLLFDTYHVLTLNASNGNKEKSASNLPEISVANSNRQNISPREHLRRGHIRTYKNGAKVWIESIVVNPGVGGKIVKDYLIK